MPEHSRQIEVCLWVRDATKKRHPNPEAIRCKPGDAVQCRPCLEQQGVGTQMTLVRGNRGVA